MPVTARLSKAFYDQFGEQVTNELVEWFNQVDLTYRNDLRALNDTNFARFEAVLGARFAQAELRIEKRFAEVEVHTEKRFTETEVLIEKRFGQVEARLAQLEVQLQRALVQHLRWTIGLWMTSMIGILAVLATLLRQGG